jgi:crotonobetainyl-CoA:carnitine CoA-transferase CaiB-like acyl-CoA transferase
MAGRAGPLNGIRVLDFTERMQGPYATQMLADMGADVVKVERRVSLTADGRSDDRYGANGRYGQDREDSTIYAAGFLANNRNKRSVTADLKSAAGLAMIERLIPQFDVLYENFRPGVMDRLGLSYERCKELNPRIIYVSATGYGADGPHAAKPGQDVLIEARTGWGQLNSVDGRPVPVASAVADTLGAMNGAFGTPARSCTRSAPVRASGCGPACTSLPLRAWRSGDFTFSTPPRVNPNGRGRDMRARAHRRRTRSMPPRTVTSRCQADARSARSRGSWASMT